MILSNHIWTSEPIQKRVKLKSALFYATLVNSSKY